MIAVFLICDQYGIANCIDRNSNLDTPLDSVLDSMQVSSGELWILIDKSDYRMQIMAYDIVVKTYPVVFGANPKDDKLMQGDQCTPEGTFTIRTKYPHKDWSKFIWINYPNESSWKKHNSAKEKGAIPEDAQIGGEIGIHGVPKGYEYAISNKMNWTLGCVSMTNDDVNELYPHILEGMKITIKK